MYFIGIFANSKEYDFIKKRNIKKSTECKNNKY